MAALVITDLRIALKSYRQIIDGMTKLRLPERVDEQQRTRLTPMESTRQIFFCGMLAAAVMAVAHSPRAQIQTTGTPGSPGPTTTIDGKQLPPPDPKFGGVI